MEFDFTHKSLNEGKGFPLHSLKAIEASKMLNPSYRMMEMGINKGILQEAVRDQGQDSKELMGGGWEKE